jgi:hypothetical protein
MSSNCTVASSGVILRSRLGISGLTSAATIWVMAAAGIVIGAGYGGAGLALSLLILALITVIALTICPAIVKGLPCFSPSVIDIIVKITAPRLTRVNVRKPTGFSFRVRSIPTIAPHSTATRIRTTVAKAPEPGRASFELTTAQKELVLPP